MAIANDDSWYFVGLHKEKENETVLRKDGGQDARLESGVLGTDTD